MDAVIVLLILLFVLLAIGVPVGFAIGGATMISMFFFSDLNMVVNAQYCYSGIFSFTVMAIPYFMLAGTIMSTGAVSYTHLDVYKRQHRDKEHHSGHNVRNTDCRVVHSGCNRNACMVS